MEGDGCSSTFGTEPAASILWRVKFWDKKGGRKQFQDSRMRISSWDSDPRDRVDLFIASENILCLTSNANFFQLGLNVVILPWYI